MMHTKVKSREAKCLGNSARNGVNVQTEAGTGCMQHGSYTLTGPDPALHVGREKRKWGKGSDGGRTKTNEEGALLKPRGEEVKWGRMWAVLQRRDEVEGVREDA